MESNQSKRARTSPTFGTPERNLGFESFSEAELLEKREKLNKRKVDLDRKIDALRAGRFDENLKQKMQALHTYNDVKDLTQSVIGFLAEIEQTTVTQIHKELELPLNS